MKTNTKQNIRQIISVILFLAILFSVYLKVSWILNNKLSDNKIGLLYDAPKDSLDVVFVGSSHIHYGISPMQLWHDYGFASLDTSSPAQSIPTSYYVIKEVIRTQHPKVIVLDVYYLFYNLYARNQGHLHEVSDAMPFFSKARYEMINDLVPKTEGGEDVWSFYFTIAYSHSRWKELEPKDFYPENAFMKGQTANADIMDVSFYKPAKKEVKIPDLTMDYLDKIRLLCEENDTELLLICVPYTMETERQVTMRRHLSMLKQFEQYAKENECVFLNIYDRMNEFGIDTATDFCSPGHLNLYGAEKMTEKLGSYLKSSYDLPDRRNQAEYASWEDDYIQYEQECQKIKRAAEYLRSVGEVSDFPSGLENVSWDEDYE